MAKKYISAELQVVRLTNNVILTSVHTVDSNYHNNYQSLTSGRRDIWADKP